MIKVGKKETYHMSQLYGVNAAEASNYIVVVSGENGAAFNAQKFLQVCRGNGFTVMSRGASPQLVQQCKGVFGSVFQYRLGFCKFDKEC